MSKVYINSIGAFLPGEPVKNSEIEEVLGLAGGKRSKNKAPVLRQNRIKTRHYSLDKSGNTRFTNSQMASYAIKDAIEKSEVSLNDIGFLASSTTIGDVLLPGLSSNIQAELNIGPIEIASMQSVCASSMMAMKNAYLQVKTDEHECAAVSGSELSSRYLKASFYENTEYFKQHGQIPMESDFLRFTLSDGAGATILENKPNEQGLSLEIKWIDIHSYSHRFDMCMVGGLSENNDKFWGDYQSPTEAENSGALVLKQDFDLLYKMFPVWTSHYLDVIDRKSLDPDSVDYLCSHYSAHSLKLQALSLLQKTGAHIPEERWFSNLYTKGNTGTASIFIILEELYYSGKLKSGQRILCHVPESGRCLNALMLLEVV